jgi:subtilisin family serine protease
MRKLLALSVAVILLVSLFTAAASAGPGPDPAPAEVSPEVLALLETLAPGEMTTVVVTLHDQADLSSIPGASRAARLNGVIRALQAKTEASQKKIVAFLKSREAQGKVADFTSFWILNAISVTATAEVIQELAQRSDVASITSDDIPVVPTAGGPQANVMAVNAPAVWDAGFTGQGVVVANLDSGVDANHPDLAGNWRGGSNSWFDPYNQHPTTPIDLTGHGTGTMGVMVGGNAGGTSIGVAPGAQWIAARIFNDRGRAKTSAIHAAFQWLLDPDGNPNTADAPNVVNNSWSYGSGSTCNLAFQLDLQALRAAGIVPVFAAGNFGPGSSTSVSPANYPEALAVGAIDGNDGLYALSGQGPSSCGESSTVYPEIVAPGVGIRTAQRFGLYQTTSGTSLAAPHTAGALALLLSFDSNLTASEQEAALIDSAADLGAPGPDNQFGYGRLDALAAYQSLQDPPPPTTTTTTTTTTTVPPTTTTTTTVPPTTTTTTTTAPPSFPGLNFSTSGNTGVPAVGGTADNADIYNWSGTAYTRVSDASAIGLPNNANVDGYVRVDDTHFYLSFSGSKTNVSGLGNVQDEDIVYYNGGAWSMFFDGTAAGMTNKNQDLDAIDIVDGIVYFSTVGNTKPPGVMGTADDADIYSWDGSSFARMWDASSAGLPGSADVDGLAMVDSTLYLSFNGTSTTVPTLGAVADVSIVSTDAGVWSVFFNGTSSGLSAGSGHDLDAIDIP